MEILSAVGEVSVLCILLVVVVHAAGFSASFEPEIAKLASGAVSKSNATASGGQYMVFGSGVAIPTPTPTPTLLPTPVPVPAPVASVTYGWQLTASNTGLTGVGINRTNLPIFSGTIKAGMTISQMKIIDGLDLSEIPNVTLDRVWLAPVGAVRALILGPGTVIKDSDIDGSSMVAAERIGMYGDGLGDYTIARNTITNVSIGAWLDGDGPGIGTMTDTYIHNMGSIAGAHVDGATRRSGTGVLTIDRSRIDVTSNSVTGSFFLQNTWGGKIAGITLRSSYLEGPGYNLTLENKGAGTSVSLDNVRIRSTGYGPVTTSGTIVFPVWSNVRVYDGSRLPAADGAVIAIP